MEKNYIEKLGIKAKEIKREQNLTNVGEDIKNHRKVRARSNGR